MQSSGSAPVAPSRVDAAALARLLRRRSGEGAPWLHQEVARRMAERLSLIRLQPQRLIDWWSAAGGSAELLAQQYPRAQLIAVEPAPEFAVRRARAPWWKRLSAPSPLVVADDGVAGLAPAQALWANMVLHWIDDIPKLLARWQAAIEVDGFLMFSCFGPDTLRELRALYAREQIGVPASAFVDMHDLGDALVHAGFADPVMDMQMLRLTWPDAQALLQELRGLGGNTAPQRFMGLHTRRWREHLEASLQAALAGPDGRLTLSFEILFGHAFKPMPRARLSARTEVALDDMRAMVRRPRST